ncbi:MAG: TolC family protein [Armatimonadetes bacterium]|nr:TolC family protein [Armatimonadota bacterium]MDW8121317.1 TolC family protein [Armatimonadota bacterium]
MRALAGMVLVILLPYGHYGSAQTTVKLTLQQCVERAWAQNPQVGIAEKTLRAAEERVVTSRAGLLPQLSLGHQFRRYLSSRVNIQVGVPVVTVTAAEFRETTLSLTQTLFDSFRTPLQVRQAQAQARQLTHSLERTKADLALQVTQQYFEVLRARALVRLNERVLERAKRLLEATQAGFQAGTVARLDVLRAQVSVKSAEVDLLAAQNNERVALLTLANLLSLRPDETLDIEETVPLSFQVPSLDDSLARALRRRPEIRESEWARERAAAAVRLARLETLPSLDLVGNYNIYPATSRRIGTRKVDREWAISLLISYPIFDGGRVRAQLREAQLNQEQTDLQYARTVDTIRLEVQRSFYTYQNAQQRLEGATAAVKEAEETARLTEEAYRAGTASILDVINAQLALAQAETQLVQAQYDLGRATYQILHAMGEITEIFSQPAH